MDAAVKVDSNVTIKVLEGNKLLRTISVHNKATTQMVQGLLGFLSGDFTPVDTNPSTGATTMEKISAYVPVYLHLGNIGVKMANRDTAANKPILLGINKSEFKVPTFDDYKLQADISDIYTSLGGNIIKFDTATITSFDDPNNSMGLLLQAKIPAGQLVGLGDPDSRTYFTDHMENMPSGRGWTYYNSYNQRYEAMFTELGLFSNTNDLLARVLLDGEISINNEGAIIFDDDTSPVNPLIQSDNTSLVVEWRIGIISLGQNDHIVSGANVSPEPVDLSVLSEQYLYSDDYIRLLEGSLEIINVPNGIETIKTYTFYNQSNVKSVVIPKSVTTIEESAFLGCISLEDVYYTGTEEEWNNITISSTDNDELINATKHYEYKIQYIKLDTKPNDWDENYNTYYVYDENESKYILNDNSNWDEVKDNIYKQVQVVQDDILL